MKPIEPQQRDSIPREVATAMLTEPRARLTNRMRKNCIAAREIIFASEAPFRKIPAPGHGYSWKLNELRTPDEKMKRRFGRATLRQLGNWLRRSIVRREVVQRRYLAVPNSDVRAFQAHFDAVRASLALLAERLDLIRDVCEDEINVRENKCKHTVALRRGGRTSVDFYTAP